MDDLSQTGCGFQYKKISAIKYESNPECYQWGMYPFGELIYPDAQVGKTWGSYPFDPAAITATTLGAGAGGGNTSRKGRSRLQP